MTHYTEYNIQHFVCVCVCCCLLIIINHLLALNTLSAGHLSINEGFMILFPFVCVSSSLNISFLYSKCIKYSPLVLAVLYQLEIVGNNGFN
jgi:hypothetical protein